MISILETVCSIPEYGQLYKIIDMPSNERNSMFMNPINETGKFMPKENSFWKGRCCYILNNNEKGLVDIIICNKIFMFKFGFLLFTVEKSIIEKCSYSYLISKQKESFDSKIDFMNSNKYKFLKSLIKK